MTGPQESRSRKILEELGLAAGLLTRLPVPAFDRHTSANFASAFWAFPLIGLLIAGLGAIAALVSHCLLLGEVSTVLFAIVAMILVSGALHEDGLADFWDGLGGGRTQEKKLAIMRDSHIGTYGVLALLLTFALQVSLLTEIMKYGLPSFLASLFCVEATGRAGLAIPLCSIPPSRADGLGASVGPLRLLPLAVGIGSSAVISIVLLGWPGMALLIGAALGAAFITAIAARFLGGFTGDVLGAAVMTARITALSAALSAMQL